MDAGSDADPKKMYAAPAFIDASAADVKLIGEDAADNFGYSVSGAGDVNNDGFDDVTVGTQYDDTGGANAGAAYIFFWIRITSCIH